MAIREAMAADLYANARIRTQAETVPDADAMIVTGGRVNWVGREDDLGTGLPLRRHDLWGATVWPALGDAHTHFLWYALLRQRIDLRGATDLVDALGQVREYAAAWPERQWLQGHGWNENEWREGTLPSRLDLDSVTDRPAAFTRADGHLVWVNSAALAAVGVGADTPDPAHGHIDRDEHGMPTGILRESAMHLVLDRVPPPTLAERLAAVRAGQEEAHGLGLASLHTMEDRETLEALQAAHDSGDLKLRVTVLLPVARLDSLQALGLRCGFGDEWLRLGQLKVFSDGSLGSRTAWMLEPFEDDAANRGIAALDEAGLRQTIGAAHAAGWPCAVHAIGDAANRAVLDALAGVPRVAGTYPDRIEHVQIIRPEDMRRLAGLGVVASMQPVHVSTDWRVADRLWGVRSRWSYAWRSVAEAGAVLAFGSDAPVESLDPWAGLQVAVTRRGLDGLPEGGWYAQERLDLAAALSGFTTGVARAGGQNQGGRLAPGSPADFIVLDRDPFTLPPESLGGVEPVRTVIGGETVYGG
ncbi:MAG: amidohydrolase [Anaerolineae bacterium]